MSRHNPIVLTQLVVGATLMVVLPAHASTGPQRPAEEIIVTGTRESRAALRARAVAYVRSLGVIRGERAVARWIDPVCPKALGLSARHALLVEAQIRSVAEAHDIATGNRSCRPNLTVSFVSNATAIVQRIATREPRILDEVPVELRNDLLASDAPIRWWYATERRGKDGDRPMAVVPPAVQLADGASLPSGPTSQILSHYNPSIVDTPTVRALRSATIMVDVDRAAGASLEAVANYAAVVGLAEIRLGGGPESGSILSLFEGSARAGELTEWDKSFLRELYRLPLNRLARYQRGRLVDALKSGAQAR